MRAYRAGTFCALQRAALAICWVVVFAHCSSNDSALEADGGDGGPRDIHVEADAAQLPQPPEFVDKFCFGELLCFEYPKPHGFDLHGIHGSSVRNIWAVGEQGIIAHSDDAATTWKIARSPTTRRLNAVFAVSANDAWAVGEAGTILHFDGTRWADTEAGGEVEEALVDVAVDAAGVVWVAGASERAGVVLHKSAGGWSRTEIPDCAALTSIELVGDTPWVGGGGGAGSACVAQRTESGWQVEALDPLHPRDPLVRTRALCAVDGTLHAIIDGFNKQHLAERTGSWSIVGDEHPTNTFASLVASSTGVWLGGGTVAPWDSPDAGCPAGLGGHASALWAASDPPVLFAAGPGGFAVALHAESGCGPAAGKRPEGDRYAIAYARRDDAAWATYNVGGKLGHGELWRYTAGAWTRVTSTRSYHNVHDVGACSAQRALFFDVDMISTSGGFLAAKIVRIDGADQSTASAYIDGERMFAVSCDSDGNEWYVGGYDAVYVRRGSDSTPVAASCANADFFATANDFPFAMHQSTPVLIEEGDCRVPTASEIGDPPGELFTTDDEGKLSFAAGGFFAGGTAKDDLWVSRTQPLTSWIRFWHFDGGDWSERTFPLPPEVRSSTELEAAWIAPIAAGYLIQTSVERVGWLWFSDGETSRTLFGPRGVYAKDGFFDNEDQLVIGPDSVKVFLDSGAVLSAPR